MSRQNESGPAALTRPGPDTEGMNFDASSTLLAMAVRLVVAMKTDTAYQRDTLLGPDVRAFLTYLKPRRQPRTLDSYEEALRYLCLDFPGTKIAEFTTTDLGTWIDRKWGHMKPATQRQRTAAIRSFFKWASDFDVLDGKSPARQLEPPPLRTDQDKQRRALSPDEMEQLIEMQPDLHDRIAIQLLGKLGMRRNELRRFQLKHYNAETGYLLVAHGKGGKTRSIPVTPRLRADLYLYVSSHEPDEYLLGPHKAEKAYADTSMPYWWEARLKAAGLEDIVMHELRYTAATRLYEATKDLVLVQRFLGHTNPKITEGYLDLSVDGLETAMAGIE